MNRKIAEPYCNWTPDEGAKAAPILVFLRATGVLALCAFTAMPLMGILATRYHSIDVSLILPIAFGTLFISAIAHCVAKSKASTSLVRCSRCRQNMKHAQHNFPAKANAGFYAGLPHIEGADGRQYIQQGGCESTPCWYRVLQELKICEKCKRFVVIQKMKLVPIGENRSNVDEYEARLQRQRRALAGKKFIIKRE